MNAHSGGGRGRPLVLALVCRLMLVLLPWPLAGCAGSTADPAADSEPAEPPAPPAAAPLPGDAPAAVIAGLSAAAEGSRLQVRELRLLRTDRDPWEPVEPEAAPPDVVMMTTRSCSHRQGLLRTEVTRASWYVFEAGRLRAFDHSAFDGHCGIRRVFELSPPERPEPERTLVRWVAQRHPDDLEDSADQLRMGLALVEAGRLDEADRWLASGSREAGFLRDRTRVVGDPDEIEKDARLDELSALQATLVRRLESARRAEAEEAAAQSAP